MSAIFFRDLGIPRPAHNLGIPGSWDVNPTGRMMQALAPLLQKIRPDGVLVYGDTNSTLAGALAAAQLQLPLFHVEAGLRSFRKSMPEEINRVLTDHVSDLLFAPTDSAVKQLAREGIRKGVHLVGDITRDAFRYYQLRTARRHYSLSATRPFALATVHRSESVDNPRILASVCQALNQLPLPVVWLIHPRTQRALSKSGILLGKNIIVIKPVGYLESIYIQSQAEIILTDSGGVQREAYFLRKPCVTLRLETEWRETLKTGHNALGGFTTQSILSAFNRVRSCRTLPWPAIFGQGMASENIMKAIVSFLREHRTMNGIHTLHSMGKT